MFGMANQLLAVIALAVVTTVIVNSGRGRYAPVTILPMLFVATTTSTTAYYEITGKFWRMAHQSGTMLRGWLNIGLTAMVSGLRAGDRRLGGAALDLANEARGSDVSGSPSQIGRPGVI